jgi:Recombination endonuclease VII
MAGSRPLPNPFLLAPVYPGEPGFREFVLDTRFDTFWSRREAQWRADGIPADRLSYTLLYELQGGRCGITGAHWSASGKMLAADHSHLPGGGLRGLLSARANYRLGKKETAISCGFRSYLTAAEVRYLRSSPDGLALLDLWRGNRR